MKKDAQKKQVQSKAALAPEEKKLAGAASVIQNDKLKKPVDKLNEKLQNKSIAKLQKEEGGNIKNSGNSQINVKQSGRIGVVTLDEQSKKSNLLALEKQSKQSSVSSSVGKTEPKTAQSSLKHAKKSAAAAASDHSKNSKAAAEKNAKGKFIQVAPYPQKSSK